MYGQPSGRTHASFSNNGWARNSSSSEGLRGPPDASVVIAPRSRVNRMRRWFQASATSGSDGHARRRGHVLHAHQALTMASMKAAVSDREAPKSARTTRAPAARQSRAPPVGGGLRSRTICARRIRALDGSRQRAPGLPRRAARSAPAVAPNRAIADDDAQLEQLASNPLSTPQPVLTGHGRDQVLDFGAEM